MVAKGYQQNAGIDSFDTYAPVTRLQTIRLILSLCVKHNFIIYLYVRTAFLHGLLNEDVYLKVPEGIKVPDGLILKLNKSLYGLKQSPKFWNDRFHKFVVKLGFKGSTSDYCLYVLHTENFLVYLVLYVDDIILCGNSEDKIQQVKTELSKEFNMKDLVPIRNFKGLRIEYDRDKIIEPITLDEDNQA